MSDAVPEGLSFVLPIHNQAGTVERVVAAWSALLERLGRPYEILIVDDGSTDATAKWLDSSPENGGLASRIPHLRALRHEARRGFGAALRTGLAAAQFPLVFYTGCDHAYNPADLRKLLERIDDADPDTGRKIDVVNGFRAGQPLVGKHRLIERVRRGLLRVALGMQVPPMMGWLGSRAHHYSWLVRILFGLRIGDVNGKFKLFRKKIFERIPIQSDGDFVHAEILSKANFLGCLMDELPIAERPGPFAAQAESPAPSSFGKELRRVFFHPDFGPATIVPPAVV